MYLGCHGGHIIALHVSARLQWVSLSSGSSTNVFCARGKFSESKVIIVIVGETLQGWCLAQTRFWGYPIWLETGPHFPIPSTNGREHHELGERLLGLTRTEVCGTIVEDWGSERRNSKSKHRYSLCAPQEPIGLVACLFCKVPALCTPTFCFLFFFSSRVRTFAPLSVVSNHRTFCSIIHYISTSGKTQHKSYEK